MDEKTGNNTLTTPDDILRAALDREREAHAFYADLAGGCRVDMVRELLERLGNEEYKHMRMVEEMLADLRLGHDI